VRQGGDVDSQSSLADFRHAATPLLDASVSRSGATLRHEEWRDELLKTGLRGKGGHHIDFSRVEPLAGTRWLHADAETKGKAPEPWSFRLEMNTRRSIPDKSNLHGKKRER
jgi:adenine-specific DNA-methyltransferase